MWATGVSEGPQRPLRCLSWEPLCHCHCPQKPFSSQGCHCPGLNLSFRHYFDLTLSEPRVPYRPRWPQNLPSPSSVSRCWPGPADPIPQVQLPPPPGCPCLVHLGSQSPGTKGRCVLGQLSSAFPAPGPGCPRGYLGDPSQEWLFSKVSDSLCRPLRPSQVRRAGRVTVPGVWGRGGSSLRQPMLMCMSVGTHCDHT